MPDGELLRVVVIRKGQVKPTEFRLREGEIGLSLFRSTDETGPEAILAAVRAAGKQGDLAIAEIPLVVFGRLGLQLVPTPGGTQDPAVNVLHVEARLPWWQRLVLRIRRLPFHEWFNKNITPELVATAKLLE